MRNPDLESAGAVVGAIVLSTILIVVGVCNSPKAKKKAEAQHKVIK